MWFEVIPLLFASGMCVWIAFPNEERLRERGESFARRNLAYIDSQFVPLFDRASRWGFRFGAFLSLILVAGLFVDGLDSLRLPFELAFLPAASVVLGAWALFRVHMAGREFPVPLGRAAVARARRVTLSDYIAVPLQLLAWLDVAVVVGVAGVVVAQGRSIDGSVTLKTMSAIAAAALAAVLLLVQLAGRVLCDRPQSAVDACHLYFQDAWRGEFVVGAYLFVVGGSALFLMGVALPLDSPSWVGDLVFSEGFPFFAVFYGFQAVVFLSFRMRFRRRLWSTLAPGQILLPGEPVPPKVGVSA